MPLRRGTLRTEGGESDDGGIFFSQRSDYPDDVIVVDLRKDEQSLDWKKYGPEDSRDRFSEMSDEKARQKLTEAREKLRNVRQQSENSSEE